MGNLIATASMPEGDKTGGRELALFDARGLEREVDSLWTTSNSIEDEIKNPITKFYRGTLKLFGKQSGENSVYTLLMQMQVKMGGLCVKFDRLEQVYDERAVAIMDYLQGLKDKQESGNRWKKEFADKKTGDKQALEELDAALKNLRTEEPGFYDRTHTRLKVVYNITILDGLEASIEKNMMLRNQITRRAVPDLVSAGKVHTVLVGFKEGIIDVSGYFENAIAIKMYEIQAGKLTEEAKNQLIDFGGMVNKFYRDAKSGIKQIKSIESGKLLDVGLGGNSQQIEIRTFDDSVRRYLGRED